MEYKGNRDKCTYKADDRENEYIRDNLHYDYKKIIDNYSNMKEFDIRIIGEYIEEGIIITDNKGFVEYVNDGYCTMTGCKKEDIIGIGVENLIKDLKIVLSKKEKINSIIKCEKTGKTILINSMYTLNYTGDIDKIIVICRDITNTKVSDMEDAKTYSNHDNEENLRNSHIFIKQESNQNLIGKSTTIKNLIYNILKVAPFDTTVLITGETGAGKEVIANKIHMNSSRNKGKFIKVNCASIPRNLAESEFFGYDNGSFTGALNQGKKGVFEAADGGTLLLDEIGEMPYELQTKLLRAIQFKEITRIGSNRPIKINVRIIACTSEDLLKKVNEGKFNEALYYRLNVFSIQVPPLRDRREDIPLLAKHFLNLYNEKYLKNVKLTNEAIYILQKYNWPGNVRELQSFIERLIIISEPSQLIDHTKVLDILYCGENRQNSQSYQEKGLKQILEDIEKNILEKTIRSTKSTREAAKVLKIDQSNVVRKAKKYGIKI